MNVLFLLISISMAAIITDVNQDGSMDVIDIVLLVGIILNS